jgi:hypothetical protein
MGGFWAEVDVEGNLPRLSTNALVAEALALFLVV